VLAIFATAGCGRKSTRQISGEPSAAQSLVSTGRRRFRGVATPGRTAAESQRTALDLSRLANPSSRQCLAPVFVRYLAVTGNENAFFHSGGLADHTDAQRMPRDDGDDASGETGDGRIMMWPGGERGLAASKKLDLAGSSRQCEICAISDVEKNTNR